MTQGTEDLLLEYARLDAAVRTMPEAPGRMRVLGWDLEYTVPSAVLAFVDQILVRRMNDFLSDRDRPVIVDCGANIGITVLNYKRQFPGAQITAFEPDPQFAPILRRNLARNGAADVELIEAAAWIQDGRAQWTMEGKDGSRLTTGGGEASRIVEVATVDLARYLDRDIDLLKVDIEGAEFDVLPHIAPRLDRVRNILVECHIGGQHDYERFAQILAALQAAGFAVSFNSFGPWRDLTRRHVPGPLHSLQYVIVAGWRTEHAAVSDEQTYLPYVGAPHYQMSLDRLSAAEAEAAALRAALADLATGGGRFERVPLAPPFRRDAGHCWTWRLPDRIMPGDSCTAHDAPTLVVEDGRLLGPGHAGHDDIRHTGGGRYSHWQAALYLSTSDNSDPNTNGRDYIAICRKGA